MMKSDRWKILAAVVATAVLMAACGSRKEPKAEDERKTWEEPVEASEETTEEETEKEPEEAEEPVEEPAEWVTAYREFLSDRENLVPLLLESGEGGMRGYITGFYLHDLNGDEVPELFVQKDVVADYIYTYVDSHMELRNAIAYDGLSESYFGFDARDGQVYCFELDAGTGTDRSTSMSKVTLMKTSHDMGKPVGPFNMTFDEGLEVVCSALFGSVDDENVEWEDAVFSDEQFKDLALNFVPFDFHEITDRNIETYITMGYKDTEENCSLEAYREERRERREAFRDAKFYCRVKDGEYVIPETATRTEEFTGVIYYDTNFLACFREEDLRPKFEGDWKQIYREWLLLLYKETDDQKRGNIYGGYYTPGENWEWYGFFFVDWDGVETPVLCFYDASTTADFFTVLDGEVVYLGSGGRSGGMGHTYVNLIQGTDYYFIYYNFDMGASVHYTGCLCRVGNPREIIWEICWEEVDESYWEYQEDFAEYVPEYDLDNPDCKFRGEPMAKQAAMDEVDKLLGDRAAEQIIDTMRIWDGDEKAAGPLSFVEAEDSECAWDIAPDFYTLEQVIDILHTL